MHLKEDRFFFVFCELYDFCIDLYLDHPDSIWGRLQVEVYANTFALAEL